MFVSKMFRHNLQRSSTKLIFLHLLILFVQIVIWLRSTTSKIELENLKKKFPIELLRAFESHEKYDSIRLCNCKCEYDSEKEPRNESKTINFVLHGNTNNLQTYYSTKPIIYVVTPTYKRPSQMADMTRFAQTLMHVKGIFWIVVEDSHNKSVGVSELLSRARIPYVHLLAPRPKKYDKVLLWGRGVSNRLKALKWLRNKFMNKSEEGVIYFADDDNSYDIRLFEEFRFTRKVSMFPVGLISKQGISSPILNNETAKVIGFHDPFTLKRKFCVDMAGFAVNLKFFLSKPNATMIYKAKYIEDYFLKSLEITLDEIEPKAYNCSLVLVWHTKTKHFGGPSPKYMIKVEGYEETNLPILYSNVKRNF